MIKSYKKINTRFYKIMISLKKGDLIIYKGEKLRIYYLLRNATRNNFFVEAWSSISKTTEILNVDSIKMAYMAGLVSFQFCKTIK